MAARDPSDPLWPHWLVVQRAKEKPYWVSSRVGRCSMICPNGTAVGQWLAGGEASTWVANKRHDPMQERL
jgi:hypothetical protein